MLKISCHSTIQRVTMTKVVFVNVNLLLAPCISVFCVVETSHANDSRTRRSPIVNFISSATSDAGSRGEHWRDLFA